MLKNQLIKLILFTTLLGLSGCKDTFTEIEPKIHYTIQDRYLKALPSFCSKLTDEQRNTPWGSEFLIGIHFAHNLDFYRAITAFRRAEILLPFSERERRFELQYGILLSYYLSQRYQDVDQAYQGSDLSQIAVDFLPFQDLLVILYDSYLHLEETKKSSYILHLIQQHAPKLHQDLIQYSALKKGDFLTLEKIDSTLFNTYEAKKKSPLKAISFNAILPGSGYLYLGQVQTALTAFLINGLFIAAILYFLKRRFIAAALIFLSFEAGWYFGGISGARTQTKFYNERTYEQIVLPQMNHQGIFPIYKLIYGF